MIVLASNNKFKIAEIRKILNKEKILTLKDVGFDEEIEETGSTFLENALIKARRVSDYLKSKHMNYLVLADDSGLCVNALNGEPGVYSARYAGVHDDNKANRAKLLSKLKDKQDRSAYYYSVVVLLKEDDIYMYGEGKVEGIILKEETMENNFGYDPLFYSTELKKSFSEATIEEKQTVSHRARAIFNLQEKLKNYKIS